MIADYKYPYDQDLVISKIVEAVFSEKDFAQYLINSLQAKIVYGIDPNIAATEVIDTAFKRFDLERTLKLFKSHLDTKGQSKSLHEQISNIDASFNNNSSSNNNTVDSADSLLPTFSSSEPIVVDIPKKSKKAAIINASKVASTATDTDADSKATNHTTNINDINNINIISSSDLTVDNRTKYALTALQNRCTSTTDLANFSPTPTKTSKSVHFPTDNFLIANTFYTREKFTRDEVSELFYSPYEGFKFSNDYTEELLRANAAGMYIYVIMYDYIYKCFSLVYVR